MTAKRPFPRLRILAVVEALDPFVDFMRQGLGLTSGWTRREGPLAAALYAFPSADLLVVEPRENDNPAAAFLKARGPGFMAFGPAEGLAGGERPLCGSGPLATLGLIDLPGTGLLMLAGRSEALEIEATQNEMDFDHISYVVGDLHRTAAEIEARSGLAMSRELGHWRFPDFLTTSAFLLFGAAYVEFSAPWSQEGPFGAQYAKNKASAMFVCLRSQDPAGFLSRLAGQGIKTGDVMEIKGLPPDREDAHAIGRVYGLPRRATQKLAFNLFDTAWPWDYLEAPG
jgi:hypothetical protein